MPTQRDFENYINKNMYENNVLEHNGVKKQGNSFIYELNVKNGDSERVEQKN